MLARMIIKIIRLWPRPSRAINSDLSVTFTSQEPRLATQSRFGSSSINSKHHQGVGPVGLTLSNFTNHIKTISWRQ